MSSYFIKYDSKNNINDQRKAALDVAEAIRKGDATVRALLRRNDLFPAEQDRRIAEAKAATAAEVAKGQAKLRELAAVARKEATYAEEPPTPEQAAVRSYYATAAMAELAGLTDQRDVLARVQAVAASGDHERAREWVRAATGRANSQALGVLQRQVEPPEARMHRSFAAAVDTMEYQHGWFARFVDQHMDRLGFISEEAKAGLAPEEGISTRGLALWADALSGRCGEAFTAAEEYAARIAESGIAGSLEYAGTEGYDASDQADAQPQGDPQGQPNAPADATADHSDAQVDA